MRKITILAVILILLGNKIYCQESYIQGKIIDYETNSTITGVTVFDTNNTQVGTLSDLNGNFKIKKEGNSTNLEIRFIGYYPIQIRNIPKVDNQLDFGEVKLVKNHLMDNLGACGATHKISAEQKDMDKILRNDVLEKYQLIAFGERFKPDFKEKYLIFDFSDND